MKYFWIVLLILFLAILGYTFFPSVGDDPVDYVQSVLAERTEKEKFMKNDPESPFRKKGMVNFGGLNYYDPDPAYRVVAILQRLDNPEKIALEYSDGSRRNYIRYALAEFELSGMAQKLVLLKSEDYRDDDRLFLPFYDETSADETYGGGRYLDIIYTGGKEVIIDFNESYNPYCAYNHDYRCPFPPAENHITVPVRAGEKNYSESH